MRILIACLGGWIACSSLAVADDLDGLISAAAMHVHDWSTTPAGTLGGFVEHALAGKPDSGALVSSVARKFGLGEESARLIVIAELRDVIDLDELVTNEIHGEAMCVRRREIESLYRAALKKASANPAVVHEYVASLNGSRACFSQGDEWIAAALAPLANRTAIALDVMDDIRAGYPITPGLLDVVLRDGNPDPLPLAAMADKLPAEAAAHLYERAARLWIARNDFRSAAAAAEGAIHAYATSGSAGDILRLYASLPAESKAVVESPATQRVVRSRGTERSISGFDARLAVAAAEILTGDLGEARRILGRAKSASAGGDEWDEKTFRAVSAMLTAAVEAPTGDAYDLVTDYMQNGRSGEAMLFDRVFDLVASRAGYGEISRWQLDRDAGLSDLVSNEVAALPEAIRKIAAVTGENARPVSPSRAPDPRSKESAAERLVPFTELPATQDAKTAASRCDVLAELKQTGVAFPPGFHPLRAEETGNEIVAMGESQDLDPVGEISGGGYWVIRSVDHGNTWRSLYTGLRELQPYELVIDSTIPLIVAGGVRLEVDRRELDESSITFPPIALRTISEKSGIVLDFTWNDLEKDSDGDGLTDLVEERIFTDPQSADSDGDGIEDATDSLPQVAYSPSARPETAIISAVLDEYYGDALTVRTGDVSEQSCEAPRLSRTRERTMLIAGVPADFTGVRTTLRAIVLTEADLAAVQKKFGRTLALHLSPIVIDRSGTRAWVDVNGEWSGATYRLEKNDDGSWSVEVVGSWIT